MAAPRLTPPPPPPSARPSFPSPRLAAGYNYQEYIIGTQPDGYAFVPHLWGALDWGSMVLNASAPGGLMPTWGNSNGGTQYSMARTAADERGAGRRTLHAWLQNGDSGGGDGPYTHDNTVALPRDISLGPRGDLFQAFVPELLALRAGATSHVLQPGLSLPVNGAPAVLALSSNQVEIVANFSLASPGGGVSFGVFLHMDPTFTTSSARTAVGIRADCAGARGTRSGAGDKAALLFFDRTLTDAAEDADVRAGPMPLVGCADASAVSASLRCFLDGPLVECIVESGGDSTAISGHAHSLMSGVGLFAYGGDGSVETVRVSVEAWGGLHL